MTAPAVIAAPTLPGAPTATAPRRRRQVQGWVGGAIIAAVVGATVLSPLIAPADPLEQDLTAILQGPSLSGGHLFGTDQTGRDLFSRVLHGGRTALLVALVAVALATVVGVVLGVVSGFAKGLADAVFSRLADMQLALPSILLALVVLAFAGGGLVPLVLVLAVTAWPLPFRLVRAHVLSTAARPFIEAASVSGAGRWAIVRRHLLPSVAPLAIVTATLGFSAILLMEASLSYLGLGVQPPTPDWGQMVQAGQAQLGGAWWLSVFPGLTLIVLLLGVQFLGDALAERFSVEGLTRSARS
jgi:peptide/nickel transport system permease protein